MSGGFYQHRAVIHSADSFRRALLKKPSAGAAFARSGAKDAKHPPLAEYIDALLGSSGVFSSAPAAARLAHEVVCSSQYLRLLWRPLQQQALVRPVLALQAYTHSAVAFAVVCVFYSHQYAEMTFTVCSENRSEESCAGQLGREVMGADSACRWSAADGFCSPAVSGVNGRVVLLVALYSAACSAVLHFIIDCAFTLCLVGAIGWLDRTGAEGRLLYLNYPRGMQDYQEGIGGKIEALIGGGNKSGGRAGALCRLDSQEDVEALESEMLAFLDRRWRGGGRAREELAAWGAAGGVSSLQSRVARVIGQAEAAARLAAPCVKEHVGALIFVKFFCDIVASSGYDMDVAAKIFEQKVNDNLLMRHSAFEQVWIDRFFVRYGVALLLLLLNAGACFVVYMLSASRTVDWFAGYFTCCGAYFILDALVFHPTESALNDFLLPALVSMPVRMAKEIIVGVIDRALPEKVFSNKETFDLRKRAKAAEFRGLLTRGTKIRQKPLSAVPRREQSGLGKVAEEAKAEARGALHEAYLAESVIKKTGQLSYPHFFFLSALLARLSVVPRTFESILVSRYRSPHTLALHPSYIVNGLAPVAREVLRRYGAESSRALRRCALLVAAEALAASLVLVVYRLTMSDRYALIAGVVFPVLLLVLVLLLSLRTDTVEGMFRFVDKHDAYSIKMDEPPAEEGGALALEVKAKPQSSTASSPAEEALGEQCSRRSSNFGVLRTLSRRLGVETHSYGVDSDSSSDNIDDDGSADGAGGSAVDKEVVVAMAKRAWSHLHTAVRFGGGYMKRAKAGSGQRLE